MRKQTTAIYVILIVVGAIIGWYVWNYATPSPAQFSIQLTSRPTTPMGEEGIILAFAGQRCIFLVAINEQEDQQGNLGFGDPVQITATAPNDMASTAVYPESVAAGQIAEVIVTPTAASTNETITVTITGERQGITQTETVTIEVIPGEDDLGETASQMRDLFIPWLAANHPELGITAETEWTGTIVNPRILVVMHYIFISDEWEIYITWHVMIPPYDWTKIYLRHRFTDQRPSSAYEISSIKAQEDPHPIEVPEWA
jgi:hypothetical protein